MRKNNKRIHSLMGVPADPCEYKESPKLISNTLIGIEVELENVRGLDFNNESFRKYWNIVEDGSLRDGGLEFVLSRPFAGSDLIKALKEFDKTISKYKDRIILSERTSVHVHIDVRSLDYSQLLKFVSLYTIFEEPLFRLAGGEDRKNGIFATSLSNAEGYINHLGSEGDSPSERNAKDIISNFSKYSACNLAAVRQYGSLEFRNHEGTYDTERILKWVNVLLLLRKNAIENELPIQEILGNISINGAEKVFKDIFLEYSDEMMYPDLEFDMFNGLRLAQDIIYSSNLYSGIDVPKAKYLKDTLFSKFYKSHNRKRFKERFERFIKHNNIEGSKPIPDDLLDLDRLHRILEEHNRNITIEVDDDFDNQVIR